MMKRHSWKNGEFCLDCGQVYTDQKTGGCFADPKPATPEPPEWVKALVADPARHLLDRADPVTDFIARRVAKRAVSNTIPTTAEPWDSRPQSVVPDEALSRAMSQPDPHDTPMRTRLMPWRGK